MKKIICVILGLLFLWYSLNMIGLTFGKAILVEKTDSMVEIILWFVLLAFFLTYLFIEKVGKYLVFSIVALWTAFQYQMYFASKDAIAGYNRFFSRTHHIIAPSTEFMIKDTYHIILDILLLLSVVGLITYIIATLRKRRYTQ